jgi:hypothetical protein
MPSIRTALLAAALPLLLHSGARAQGTPPPHKRLDVITQGMTPAQVRAILGEPVRTRRDGGLTYLYFANGCAGCGGDDYVVVRDCRVVGARFDNPNRYVVRSEPVDPTPPPAAECALAAGEPGRAVPVPLEGDSLRRAPVERPTDPVPVPAAVPTPPAAPEAPEPALPQDDPRGWRARLSLRRPATRLVAVPAGTITSPSAFGAQMGEGFIGLAYQQRTRFTDLDDGAAVIAMGFGDRQRYAALEVAATSYSTLRGGGPLETGGLSFKLHRTFGDAWGVAVGYENAVSWGNSDAGKSPYAATTHVFRLRPDTEAPFSAATATLGVGGGRFRTEDDVIAERKTANVFASLGVQVLEPVSLIADWSGQDLFAGVSVTPSRRLPLVIDAGVADLTGSAGNGARFIIAAGLGFRWLPPFFF